MPEYDNRRKVLRLPESVAAEVLRAIIAVASDGLKAIVNIPALDLPEDAAIIDVSFRTLSSRRVDLTIWSASYPPHNTNEPIPEIIPGKFVFVQLAHHYQEPKYPAPELLYGPPDTRGEVARNVVAMSERIISQRVAEAAEKFGKIVAEKLLLLTDDARRVLREALDYTITTLGPNPPQPLPNRAVDAAGETVWGQNPPPLIVGPTPPVIPPTPRQSVDIRDLKPAAAISAPRATIDRCVANNTCPRCFGPMEKLSAVGLDCQKCGYRYAGPIAAGEHSRADAEGKADAKTSQ